MTHLRWTSLTTLPVLAVAHPTLMIKKILVESALKTLYLIKVLLWCIMLNNKWSAICFHWELVVSTRITISGYHGSYLRRYFVLRLTSLLETSFGTLTRGITFLCKLAVQNNGSCCNHRMCERCWWDRAVSLNFSWNDFSAADCRNDQYCSHLHQ